MKYPQVLSEERTLDRVIAGESLARYGDGEFKLCRGASIKSQVFAPDLAQRLRDILRSSGNCLVGIPNIQSPTPKAPFWSGYHWAAMLLAKREYGSAFVTRPDSAPWIDVPEYWAKVKSLWDGQCVTLVRGSGKSLTPKSLAGATRVREIVCEPQHAWRSYRDLLRRIGRPDRVLLCAGPTATVLAVDLCAAGVHAVDLGHIGMFMRRKDEA